MANDQLIVNRVAESGLITIDLEAWYPTEEPASFDLKDYLYMGLVLREKEFRQALKNIDLEAYRHKRVAIYCSADAIVPVWAYMLAAAHVKPVAAAVHFCRPDQLDEAHYCRVIATLDVSPYHAQRVIIKGCSNKPVPVAAYVQLTERLRPVVKSLMYGEACSNVPIFKAKTTDHG
ncbi:MAG: DUF2480 family protein [Chitinophagales bacterium]|nr:DUF2480 family protein [Chitinophagales bacterium]MDW8427099.1 DUF2480 family protein [Chitinophagales bacterium]